jgi:WXXGXW repeat (2 copies)
MKKLIYLISLVGVILFFNACSAGYVSVEPAYQEVYRPDRPSESYIWIEGNWYWNNRTRTYYHRDGYWTLPRKGRNYSSGRWNKNRHGYYWMKGGWD